MLCRGLKYLLPLLAMGALFVACGDDDSGSPTGLEDDTESPGAPADSSLSQAATMFRDLNASISQAMLLMCDPDGGVLEGEQGSVEVVGTTFTLIGYSPNGEIVLDGVLTFDMATAGIDGTMTATGAFEGEIEIHITVDLSTSPPTYGGTVKLGDELYEVADLVEEAAAG